MDSMPISVVIFGSIPEAVLMLWAGLVLLGKKPHLGKILIIGILQAMSAYFIRRHLNFGPHMMAQLFTFAVYTCLILRVRIPTALLAIMIPCAIVILAEGTVMLFMKSQIVYILSLGWKRILFFLPHDILLGIIIYICTKKGVSLLDEFGLLNKWIG